MRRVQALTFAWEAPRLSMAASECRQNCSREQLYSRQDAGQQLGVGNHICTRGGRGRQGGRRMGMGRIRPELFIALHITLCTELDAERQLGLSILPLSLPFSPSRVTLSAPRASSNASLVGANTVRGTSGLARASVRLAACGEDEEAWGTLMFVEGQQGAQGEQREGVVPLHVGGGPPVRWQ